MDAVDIVNQSPSSFGFIPFEELRNLLFAKIFVRRSMLILNTKFSILMTIVAKSSLKINCVSQHPLIHLIVSHDVVADNYILQNGLSRTLPCKLLHCHHSSSKSEQF